MACVVLRCPKTGEVITTLHPEQYENEGLEVLAVDREPEDDEIWDDEAETWKVCPNLCKQREDREWDRLPKPARDRIEALERQVAELIELVSPSDGTK